MIERDEAVRLTAAESRFRLDDRVTAVAAEELQRVHEQLAHARRDVGLMEKLDRIAIFRDSGASIVNLLQIGGELRIPETPKRDIAVRRCHLAPRTQITG